MLLVVQNMSSFIYYDSFDEIYSQYTYLRLLNFFSFFLCFLFITKANIDIQKTIDTISWLVLVFSVIGVLIYFGQIFDFFDILRNRPGTGIYGQEEQVTFWLSEDHRAMSTFREPIFFSSFLFPITFLALASKSKTSYFVAIFAGLVVGLTRSDLLFFVAVLFGGLLITSFITKNFEIKRNIPVFLFLIITFLGYFSTVRECDVNQLSPNCPGLIDSEPPVWTSDPVSFSRVGDDSFDILWGNARDNFGVQTYRVLINGVAYIEIQSQGDKFTSYRITYDEVLPNSTYRVEVIAIDESGNMSVDNPTNSIDIGGSTVTRDSPKLELVELVETSSPNQEQGSNIFNRITGAIGQERIDIINFIQDRSMSFNGVGIINANYEYTKYFSNKNLIANYLTVRTSPKYMATRYKSKAFGTGDTYYLYGSINLQNLLIFNYIAHGALFLILVTVLLSIQLKEMLPKRRYFIYVMLSSFSLLLGVFEELSSFQGIILGVIYCIYREKENIE